MESVHCIHDGGFKVSVENVTPLQQRLRQDTDMNSGTKRLSLRPYSRRQEEVCLSGWTISLLLFGRDEEREKDRERERGDLHTV